jgi:hypothetical protein
VIKYIIFGFASLLLCLPATSSHSKKSCNTWKGLITKGVMIPVTLNNVKTVVLPKTAVGQWVFEDPNGNNLDTMIDSGYTDDAIIYTHPSKTFLPGKYTMKFLSGDRKQHIVKICTNSL